ncbi:uncharacterized protein LOC107648395 isoform X3 [Arachis ipaensis]|uniref:uncharacterized protein LOC107648395 isoform X3 n=1 Tax=Arachis ipaensis TaxID=130454 RepID=UPI000A2AF577|nr:uncharacterized protein LOC107648395 isoform X3 [Arachis ipaensis]XP_025657553.1 uncharacterized protein LOC112754205 isoform X1 [Arachis hypogaea]
MPFLLLFCLSSLSPFCSESCSPLSGFATPLFALCFSVFFFVISQSVASPCYSPFGLLRSFSASSMGDYSNDPLMRNQNAAVQARTKAQNRANVLQLKLIGQSRPTGLTVNILNRFEPRPPLEYKPPPEKRKCPPLTGMAQFVSKFAELADPEYAPPKPVVETPVDINNLEEYISLVVDATVKTGITRQMEAFKAGFNQVFNISFSQIFMLILVISKFLLKVIFYAHPD